MGYSVTVPEVVMRPMLLPFSSVNQSAPSGPVVMPLGLEEGVSTGYSMITPAVVMRPILPTPSVNQSAPSGPAVIATVKLEGVGIGYSVKTGDSAGNTAGTLSKENSSEVSFILKPRVLRRRREVPICIQNQIGVVAGECVNRAAGASGHDGG